MVKTPVRVNETYFLNYSLGPTKKFYWDPTSRYGDSASPAASGSATAVGTNTLTDTTKTWRIDQFKGGALFITSGPASGAWYEIDSNSIHTVTIKGSAWTAPPPAIGNSYALDYFIKKAGGGGFPHSDAGSAYEHALHNLSVANVARINSVVAGSLSIVQGSNSRSGNLTLNGVTPVVVGNTSITAKTIIFLGFVAPSGTPGAPYVSAKIVGASFSVRSSAGDTSTISYLLVEPVA